MANDVVLINDAACNGVDPGTVVTLQATSASQVEQITRLEHTVADMESATTKLRQAQQYASVVMWRYGILSS